MQRLDEAGDAFEKVVSALESPQGRAATGLFELLPSSIVIAEGEERVAAYYRHIALFFEPFEAIEHVIRFCQASIDAVGTYADERPLTGEGAPEGDLVQDLPLSIGARRLLLCLCHRHGHPYDSVRRDCLRHLVSVMCESGHIQPLLHFTFPGLQNEVEKTLSFKARNSDPLCSPNYYAVLYSYHVFRGDWKSAGAEMYQLAERLGGELQRNQDGDVGGLWR